MNTENSRAAKILVEAIKEIAQKPENLKILNGYLSQHFEEWLNQYANTPINLAEEVQTFSNMIV